MQTLDGLAAKNRQGDARTLQRMAREQWTKALSSSGCGAAALGREMPELGG